MTLTKWKSMTCNERVNHVRKGKLKIDTVMGIREDAKVNGHKDGVVFYVAVAGGIRIGQGDTEDNAYRSAYKYLNEYKGNI